MKSVSILWLTLIIIMPLSFPIGHSGQPPRIRSEMIHELVVRGNEVQMKCPVDVETGETFYEWQKDKDIYDIYSYDTTIYKVTRKGVLKIKQTRKEDSGDWTCRVTNGFGSVEAIVVLDVVDEKHFERYTSRTIQTGNHYPEGDNLTSSVSKLKWLTTVTKNSVTKPEGGVIYFKCRASGNPRPSITWFKNGKEIKFDDESRMKMDSYRLRIEDLKEADSGTYTCVVFNKYGSIHRNFTLDVVERIGLNEKPEITGHHPVNVSVLNNETATFQCRVKSKVRPVVKWLKQLSPKEVSGYTAEKQLIVKVNNESYRGLKSSELIQQTDGSYLNKLSIKNANYSHSGKYICWAANVRGYNFKSAFLIVINGGRSFSEPKSEQSLSTGAIIIIATAVVVVLSISLAAVLCAISHHRTSHNQPTML